MNGHDPETTRGRLEQSGLDIVVTEGDGDDVFIKYRDDVLLLNRTATRIIRDELTKILEGSA